MARHHCVVTYRRRTQSSHAAPTFAPLYECSVRHTIVSGCSSSELGHAVIRPVVDDKEPFDSESTVVREHVGHSQRLVASTYRRDHLVASEVARTWTDELETVRLEGELDSSDVDERGDPSVVHAIAVGVRRVVGMMFDPPCTPFGDRWPVSHRLEQVNDFPERVLQPGNELERVAVARDRSRGSPAPGPRARDAERRLRF